MCVSKQLTVEPNVDKNNVLNTFGLWERITRACLSTKSGASDAFPWQMRRSKSQNVLLVPKSKLPFGQMESSNTTRVDVGRGKSRSPTH